MYAYGMGGKGGYAAVADPMMTFDFAQQAQSFVNRYQHQQSALSVPGNHLLVEMARQ